jgi:hypothetical protein
MLSPPFDFELDGECQHTNRVNALI